MSEKGRKLSKDLETVYEVTKGDDYRRQWRKAALRWHCRAVYGVSLKDFIHVHKGLHNGYKLKQIKKSNSLF